MVWRSTLEEHVAHEVSFEFVSPTIGFFRVSPQCPPTTMVADGRQLEFLNGIEAMDHQSHAHFGHQHSKKLVYQKEFFWSKSSNASKATASLDIGVVKSCCKNTISFFTTKQQLSLFINMMQCWVLLIRLSSNKRTTRINSRCFDVGMKIHSKSESSITTQHFAFTTQVKSFPYCMQAGWLAS